ncbi:hypothetical protein [Aeromonas sp. Y318-1]|uniref:F4 family fimbrial subunit n=1 Tax=Aeromonas TaxID=642 RepID=UPI0022E3A6F4|nr:hypothetical protein [Aeromonas sp. Y318-1]
MSMNKTLLAVALATAGLSANVMALSFTDGDFNGSVDIGGTITVPTATNQWQWATGSGLDTFTHSVTVMTNGYKTLTIPMTADTPLLVGQTKAATVGAVGGVGITPRISLMQADGTTPVAITYKGTADGKGDMTLPVVDGATPTNVLGSAVVNVKVAGLGVYRYNGVVGATSGHDKDGLSAFRGAIPTAIGAAIPSEVGASTWIASLGGHDISALTGQLTTLSGVDSSVITEHNGVSTVSMAYPDAIYSGAYGLGIASGDNIVVNFTNPVAAETQWKARLNIAVTYL